MTFTEKKEKFKEEILLKALAWMRKLGIEHKN